MLLLFRILVAFPQKNSFPYISKSPLPPTWLINTRIRNLHQNVNWEKLVS